MRVACLLFSSLVLQLVKTKNPLLETQDDIKLTVDPTTKANETDQNGVKGSKWIERDQNGVEGSNGKVGMDYSSQVGNNLLESFQTSELFTPGQAATLPPLEAITLEPITLPALEEPKSVRLPPSKWLGWQPSMEVFRQKIKLTISSLLSLL